MAGRQAPAAHLRLRMFECARVVLSQKTNVGIQASLDQEYLENDEYRVLHSIIANKIFDTELRTFMERYCAML